MIAQTIMRGKDRWYPCPLCSKDHPSTTTVLDVIGSGALMGWAQKMGTKKLLLYQKALELNVNKETLEMAGQIVEQTWRSLGEKSDFWKNGTENAKTAADHGTTAHAAFEMFLQGKEVDRKALSQESGNAFGVFEQFAKENEIKTIDTETTFYNCQIGYAGTADWRGKINGRLTLSDWKTSTGIFEKNIVQAWANAIADEMQNSDNLYQQVLIGRFGKDGSTDILIAERNGRLILNGKVIQVSGHFGSYEQSRVLVQAVIPWFHYKKDWDKNFPYIKR